MDHVPDLAAMRLLLQQWVAEDARMARARPAHRAPRNLGDQTGAGFA
jgi:hypothetical protein